VRGSRRAVHLARVAPPVRGRVPPELPGARAQHATQHASAAAAAAGAKTPVCAAAASEAVGGAAAGGGAADSGGVVAARGGERRGGGERAALHARPRRRRRQRAWRARLRQHACAGAPAQITRVSSTLECTYVSQRRWHVYSYVRGLPGSMAATSTKLASAKIDRKRTTACSTAASGSACRPYDTGSSSAAGTKRYTHCSRWLRCAQDEGARAERGRGCSPRAAPRKIGSVRAYSCAAAAPCAAPRSATRSRARHAPLPAVACGAVAGRVQRVPKEDGGAVQTHKVPRVPRNALP
jgi:hypothetical protein